ncbi:C4-dicarboxylate ABC transporter [Ureibacillus massiliensis 4400831 = CIP 108448 = CCUG 49529]|uniref:C4-dicarboxylate ABC transporter n=1 Tax=Ureibacillus massiliensis 4400831 = CIP 108448 = CCUG 49529 TaxID=1211035 RepID=A0A0A3J410_9BACL|nr:DctP family TRAP transporter solute-binding subunit [Ureibacillus massiliensis]KGR91686.1 C4-dicarboxylate ABC transporter [Ureibacillus massiliensis 4400831 = CIP 108448 = CCUG 49529]RKJ41303.1 DctP family TRAP transporter solute-binding subunit [Butyricicoccus sp. 1XD8-22]
MKKWLLLTIISAFALVLAACGGGGSNEATSSEEYTAENPLIIKFSHVTAIDSVKGKAADYFAQLVDEKTEGKVKVEVYPSSQLYGDADELDALMSGNVHMIAPSVTKMVKLDPRWQYVDMPFLFENEEHVEAFFDSEVAQSLFNADALAANDIMGKAFWPNGFKNFSSNKNQLVKPEDFAGQKFRAQAGKVLEAQFQALNAGSATISFGETYAALQQGTVDGTENPHNNFDTMKFYEVQKYYTVSEHGRLDYAIFVNKSFWESIPEDLRTLVDEALNEATTYAQELAAEENAKSLEKIKALGTVEVYEMSQEERDVLKEAMQPVYDEFSEVITQELIDGINGLK